MQTRRYPRARQVRPRRDPAGLRRRAARQHVPGDPRRPGARRPCAPAYDAGIRLFDTAPLYGFGLSEHRVGAALRDKPRDELRAVDQGRPPARAAPPRHPRSRPVRGLAAVRRGLRLRLRRHHALDRGQPAPARHLADRHPAGPRPRRLDARLRGRRGSTRSRRSWPAAIGRWSKLREEGTVKAIGAGVNETAACQDLAERGDFDCFLLAGRYTLLEQAPLDGFLPLCEQRGIALLIGGAYNTGILATGAIEGAYFQYAPAPPEIMDAGAADRGGLRPPRRAGCRPRRCSSRSAIRRSPRWWSACARPPRSR